MKDKREKKVTALTAKVNEQLMEHLKCPQKKRSTFKKYVKIENPDEINTEKHHESHLEYIIFTSGDRESSEMYEPLLSVEELDECRCRDCAIARTSANLLMKSILETETDNKNTVQRRKLLRLDILRKIKKNKKCIGNEEKNQKTKES